MSVEDIAPIHQARGLLAEVVEMVRAHVESEDERHDVRVVVETSEAEFASDAVAISPGGGDASLASDSGTAEANNRLLGTALRDALRENRELMKAATGLVQSCAATVGSLAMVHGVSGEKRFEYEMRVMEHEEEMRRWSSVDNAADKLIGPLADKLGDLFVSRFGASTVMVDPIALAKEMLASMTPAQLADLASAVDFATAQDIASAIKAAAEADDVRESWARWEAAATRIKPHAAKLAAKLTRRQMEILRQVSQGFAAYQRAQG